MVSKPMTTLLSGGWCWAFLFIFLATPLHAQNNTLNVWLKNGKTVSYVFRDQPLRVVATSPAQLTIESGIHRATYYVDSLRKFTVTHTDVVTIEDITRLITQYLAPGSTVTLDDITTLIDAYLKADAQPATLRRKDLLL